MAQPAPDRSQASPRRNGALSPTQRKKLAADARVIAEALLAEESADERPRPAEGITASSPPVKSKTA